MSLDSELNNSVRRVAGELIDEDCSETPFSLPEEIIAKRRRQWSKMFAKFEAKFKTQAVVGFRVIDINTENADILRSEAEVEEENEGIITDKSYHNKEMTACESENLSENHNVESKLNETYVIDMWREKDKTNSSHRLNVSVRNETEEICISLSPADTSCNLNHYSVHVKNGELKKTDRFGITSQSCGMQQTDVNTNLSLKTGTEDINSSLNLFQEKNTLLSPSNNILEHNCIQNIKFDNELCNFTENSQLKSGKKFKERKTEGNVIKSFESAEKNEQSCITESVSLHERINIADSECKPLNESNEDFVPNVNSAECACKKKIKSCNLTSIMNNEVLLNKKGNSCVNGKELILPENPQSQEEFSFKNSTSEGTENNSHISTQLSMKNLLRTGTVLTPGKVSNNKGSLSSVCESNLDVPKDRKSKVDLNSEEKTEKNDILVTCLNLNNQDTNSLNYKYPSIENEKIQICQELQQQKEISAYINEDVIEDFNTFKGNRNTVSEYDPIDVNNICSKKNEMETLCSGSDTDNKQLTHTNQRIEKCLNAPSLQFEKETDSQVDNIIYGKHALLNTLHNSCLRVQQVLLNSSSSNATSDKRCDKKDNYSLEEISVDSAKITCMSNTLKEHSSSINSQQRSVLQDNDAVKHPCKKKIEKLREDLNFPERKEHRHVTKTDSMLMLGESENQTDSECNDLATNIISNETASKKEINICKSSSVSYKEDTLKEIANSSLNGRKLILPENSQSQDLSYKNSMSEGNEKRLPVSGKPFMNIFLKTSMHLSSDKVTNRKENCFSEYKSNLNVSKDRKSEVDLTNKENTRKTDILEACLNHTKQDDIFLNSSIKSEKIQLLQEDEISASIKENIVEVTSTLKGKRNSVRREFEPTDVSSMSSKKKKKKEQFCSDRDTKGEEVIYTNQRKGNYLYTPSIQLEKEASNDDDHIVFRTPIVLNNLYNSSHFNGHQLLLNSNSTVASGKRLSDEEEEISFNSSTIPDISVTMQEEFSSKINSLNHSSGKNTSYKLQNSQRRFVLLDNYVVKHSNKRKKEILEDLRARKCVTETNSLHILGEKETKTDSKWNDYETDIKSPTFGCRGKTKFSNSSSVSYREKSLKENVDSCLDGSGIMSLENSDLQEEMSNKSLTSEDSLFVSKKSLMKNLTRNRSGIFMEEEQINCSADKADLYVSEENKIKMDLKNEKLLMCLNQHEKGINLMTVKRKRTQKFLESPVEDRSSTFIKGENATDNFKTPGSSRNTVKESELNDVSVSSKSKKRESCSAIDNENEIIQTFSEKSSTSNQRREKSLSSPLVRLHKDIYSDEGYAVFCTPVGLKLHKKNKRFKLLL